MTRPRAVVALLLGCGFVAFAALLLATGSAYMLRVMSVAGVFAILALGYQFIFGHAGALALSQGSFMGVGAYVSAVLATRFGLPFDAALPFSVAAPVVVALVVAIPVLRLQTHYLALATLIVGQILLLLATQWESVTGGANGIGGVPGLALFGHAVPAGRPALAMIWGCVALGAGLLWLLTRGRRGAGYALLRAGDAAAWSIGLPTARMRLLAFLLSAAYAGLAGSLSVHVIRVVSPDVLGFPAMVTCLTIAVVGSRLRSAGAIAAAILVIGLPEWIRPLRDAYLLAYGAILLAVIVALPDGLVVAAERLVARVLPEPVRSPPAAVAPAPPPGSIAGALLRIERVSRRFGGVLALDQVSLQMGTGEIVGLIGPNGSGKTTLLNAVTGLFPPQHGTVQFAGHDITRRAPHRIARLGLARSFQTVTVIAEMTALENVAISCAKGEAMALLDLLGVADAAMTPCAALPASVLKRVEIARALSIRPRLLLLDEPAAGLTAREQDDLAACLRGVAASGLGLLVVEHNMPFLARLADRLICLADGRIIADGLPADIRADPRVIEVYLGVPAG